MSQPERTLVLVEPDAVERGLTGEILSRIERKGYQIVELSMLQASHQMLVEHYEEHEGKDFFEPLVNFMAEGPVVAAIVEGERVIEGIRALAGIQIRRWLSQEPSVVTSAATGAKAYRKTLSTPRTRHCRLSVRSTSGSANCNTYSNRAPETTPVPSLFLRKTPRYSGALRAREWAGQPGLGSAGHQWCSAQEYP